MGDMIEIATLDGSERFGCYLAEPSAAAKAAIVVIQEVFGVNPGIRTKCDAWAAKGYLAIAPDLFWRIEPGFETDPDAEGGLQKGIAMIGRFDVDKGIADIEAAIHEARSRTGGGKVGAVGFCLGGRLAYLAATRTDVDASVGYYGAGLEGVLHEAHAIARPLMLHIPEADHFVPPPIQQQIHAALDGHPKATLHDYPGLDHGFATTTGERRDEAGAQLADGRTEAFFAEHLG